MTEGFLHYIWQHQLFDKELSSTDGQPIVVIRAGDHNKDAGPDFYNSHLRIGNVEWVGTVEIHIHSSDWNAHQHQYDPTYNNVILHVVYEEDAEIYQQNGKQPPTLSLKRYMHPSLIANYEMLVTPTYNPIPCSHSLSNIPEFVIGSALSRMTIERIEEKATVVRRLLEESHGGWELTCYWLIAHYFGGVVNSLPFEMLAKATDPRLLARWRDNPTRIEALLMGQSGLLEGTFFDEYPLKLQADYTAIRTGADLQPIDTSLWKFHRIRPSAFPTIRISQFSSLLSNHSNLFSTLLEVKESSKIEHIFEQTAAPYWNSHYQFDQPSERTCKKRIGRMQADLLIINAWVPLLFVYGSMYQLEEYKDQALDILEQLRSENNSIIRTWEQVGIIPTNAAQSQALLQLYHHYCTKRRCLECRIGFHLLKHV